MKINVKIIKDSAVLPEYKTLHSAGADLYACLETSINIKPMEIFLVPTGIIIEIPEGYEAQVRPRSGLAAQGLILPNSPGTIDADYRGEIKVILMNLGKDDFKIQNHDRIAQLIIQKTEKADFQFAEELSETERGEGGFGSTGIRR